MDKLWIYSTSNLFGNTNNHWNFYSKYIVVLIFISVLFSWQKLFIISVICLILIVVIAEITLEKSTEKCRAPTYDNPYANVIPFGSKLDVDACSEHEPGFKYSNPGLRNFVTLSNQIYPHSRKPILNLENLETCKVNEKKCLVQSKNYILL